MLTKLLPCCFVWAVITGGPAKAAPESHPPGHPENLYGKRLSYRQAAGIGPCMAVEVVGDRLYAIGQGNLYVCDISQPENPKLLGKLSGLGTTRQLVIRDKLAYITARQDGLWIVDLSDSARPILVSHYDTVEMATGIWVSGGIGFIATRCYGVEIVDVSNPRRVQHLSTLKTGEAQSCWARDGLLYIGDWAPKQLLVANVSNPRQPFIIGEGDLDGYGDGGCLRGQYCFAATGHHLRSPDEIARNGRGHGLEIFDVSQPAQPRFVSRVKFPAYYHYAIDTWSARVSGNYCFVSDTYNGLFVVDIQDVAKPVIVAHAQLPFAPKDERFDPVGGLAITDGVIYAAGAYTGLYVVSAPGLAKPLVPEADKPPVLPAEPAPVENPDFLTCQPKGQVYAAALQGDIAWLACGAAGIQAVRLGENLKPVGEWPSQRVVSYVSVSGNRLYAAEGEAGLGIYEITPDLRMRKLGRLETPGQGVKQVVAPAPGHYALIHCGGARVDIVDVRNPASPSIVFTDKQVGLFYGDQLVNALFDERYLVAYWQRSGPAWYDVSGATPVLMGNTPDTTLYSWTDGACALGNKLLVTKRGKYTLLEPNERRRLSDLPACGAAGTTIHGRPSVFGHLLAVSQRHERQVSVFDITERTRPQLQRRYTFTGHPGACSFWQGRLVVPAGYQGLMLERKK